MVRWATGYRSGSFQSTIDYPHHSGTVIRNRSEYGSRSGTSSPALAQKSNPSSRTFPGSGSSPYKYDWPGNVRQLRNVIHRAVLMDSGEIIEIDDLPQDILHSQSPAPARFGINPGDSHLIFKLPSLSLKKHCSACSTSAAETMLHAALQYEPPSLRIR